MRDLISDFNSMKAIPNSIPKNAIPTPIQMMAIPIQFQFRLDWVIPIQFQFNSEIGLGISKKIQFRSGIDPDSALGSPLRCPISNSWPPTHGALKRFQRRPPSPISITILHRICYWAHKRMTLHSMPLATMITNNFCACRSFSMSQFRQNCLVFVEFMTSFFRVSTCFNGCAAAMDARPGFGTPLRWFCDRGVW